MQFMLTPDWEAGANALSARIIHELKAGRRVLWLTSGGSNVNASVSIMNSVPDDASKLLSIMPGDERYGEPGHKDSNFEALVNAGFNKKQAELIPVLERGLSFEETAKTYQAKLAAAFSENDVSLAQFGIGEDGHICGILPHSPAASETEKLIAAYHSDPYDRLSMTFQAIRQLSAVYVLAYGRAKRDPLYTLKHEEVPLGDQPSQILRQLKEAYVYNDQIGGEQP